MELSLRIDRNHLFKELAKTIAQRSTCPRLQVGAILVRDGRIISMGYNGAPSGLEHCSESSCIIENNHCVRAVHAEVNVIAFAAKEGIATKRATLYCTHYPCLACAKILINSGLLAIYYENPYGDMVATMSLLHDAGVYIHAI